MVIRELEREDKSAVGRRLIEVPGYTYRVFVTNRDEDPVELWRDYNQRACLAQRIYEASWLGAIALGVSNSCRGLHEALLRALSVHHPRHHKRLQVILHCLWEACDLHHLFAGCPPFYSVNFLRAGYSAFDA